MVKTNKGVVIESKNNLVMLSKEFAFALFLFAVVLVFNPNKVSAASFDVAAGAGNANDGDSICQLEEAIANINTGEREYPDCVEDGTYGDDDTVKLPAGTITIGSGSGSGFNLEFQKSAKIIGQGMGVSIVEGGQGWSVESGSGSEEGIFEFKNFTSKMGILAFGADELNVEGVEVEFPFEYNVGINNGGVTTLAVKDSYIHPVPDIDGSGISIGIYNSMMDGSGVGDSTERYVSIENTTISDVNTGIMIGDPSDDYGVDQSLTMNAIIKNTTITNSAAAQDLSGSGLGMLFNTGILATTGGEDSGNFGTINYTTKNNTYNNITSPYSDGGKAISEVASGAGVINHVAQNDLYATGNGNDSTNYIRTVRPNGDNETGSPTFNTTSLGGNLSSDGSFASFLSEPTDKHNKTSLASFLGALGDNGGPVPTLALKTGSPAIDAGTTAASVTTDARGIARPQGTAYDSGAFELKAGADSDSDGISDAVEDAGPNGGDGNNDGTPDSEQSNVTSFVNKETGQYTTLAVDEECEIVSVVVDGEEASKPDGSYSYPAGLMDFVLDCETSGFAANITQYNYGLEDNDFVVRKYNPSTGSYATIDSATVSEQKIDGKTVTVASYQVKDGGALDLDGEANGKIVDPAGLAETSANGLANTGQNSRALTFMAGMMTVVGGGVGVMARLKRRVTTILLK